jgi:hypothetical protein
VNLGVPFLTVSKALNYQVKQLFALRIMFLLIITSVYPAILWADTITSVPLPCLEKADIGNPRLDLKLCSTFLSTTDKTGIIPMLNRYYENRVKCIYEGKVLSDISDKTTAENIDCSSVGSALSGFGNDKAVVCDSISGEDRRNHLQQECGTPGDGKWELAHQYGLWTQMVKVYSKRVIDQEIIAERKLKISGTACQAMAEDYMANFKGAEDAARTVSSVIGKLPPEVLRHEINPCPTESNATFTTQFDSAKGSPSIVACLLVNNANNQAMAIAQLAECEIWTRVTNTYIRTMESNASSISRIVRQCAEDAKDSAIAATVLSLGIAAAFKDAMIERFFRNCYSPQIRPYFLRRIP